MLSADSHSVFIAMRLAGTQRDVTRRRTTIMDALGAMQLISIHSAAGSAAQLKERCSVLCTYPVDRVKVDR